MNRAAALGFIGLLAFIVYACSVGTSGSMPSSNADGVALADGTVFSRARLLEAFGNCMLAEIEIFKEQSEQFAETAALAVSAPNSAETERARDAWREAVDTWQRLELMQVGPAARKTQPGGQNLRQSIYPWPHRDHCEIDQYLVTDQISMAADQVSAAAKGLWAAEYVLFRTDGANACPEEDTINADGSWNALDAETLSRRRIQYAAVAARTVAETASALLDAWSPDDGNFLAELSQAGDGSRTYGNKRVALNAVSDALGYIEWGIKDQKLARPLGLKNCEERDCMHYLEARFSRRSKLHLRNNILGFRKLFLGCGPNNEGLGFDDYLSALGATDIADEIDQASLTVLTAIDAIDALDLSTALSENDAQVLAVHQAVSALSMHLRRDFLTVLRLELPQMVQGDND